MALFEGKMIGKAAKGLGNILTGGAINEYQDRRQLRQQKKLQEQQIAGSKELGRFNQELAIDTWNKTNYEAQRKHMEAAGLNVGLMYGGAGASGTTSGGSAGNVQGGTAQAEMGMGMQLGMQLQMQQAQIENLQAQTAKTKAETAKTAGIDTAVAAGTLEKLAAETSNEKLKAVLIGLDSDLKSLEVEKGSKSMQDILNTITQLAKKAEAEARTAEVEAGTKEETQTHVINQIKQASVEQGLRIATQQAGIQKAGAEIRKIGAEISKMNTDQIQGWEKLSQTERETQVKTLMAHAGVAETIFNTNNPEHVKQWTDIITEIIKAMK